MARFPDGWIIIIKSDKPTFKDGTVTIPTEDRELIMCKHCKYSRSIPNEQRFECSFLGKVGPNWFCADGEKRKKHAEQEGEG